MTLRSLSHPTVGWRLRAGFIGLLVTMATLVVALQPARAATTTCAQFGTVSINGNQYIYQQNEWNSSLGQCASVDASTGAWSLTQASFNLPTNGAPATYPSVFRGCQGQPGHPTEWRRRIPAGGIHVGEPGPGGLDRRHATAVQQDRLVELQRGGRLQLPDEQVVQGHDQRDRVSERDVDLGNRALVVGRG